MSGETSITVIGNLTGDPELRFTTGGAAVANFTIASTPRAFDPASKDWKDGDTLFLRASIWHEAAENVAASLAKGSRVVASGVLKPRTYETKSGEKRSVLELEVDELGLSLRYTAISREFMNIEGSSPGNGSTQDGVTAGTHPADGFTISPREYADDDAWFGLRAHPSGVIAPPVITETPVYKSE
jgi:single-strand DNA-binding protein